MNIKTYFPGMGEAVADRTVNRRIFTQAQKAKLPHTILINPKDDLHDVWRNAAELSCWPFRITSDAPFQTQEPETRIEGWADVAERVAEGNAGLVHGEEYDATELFSHIASGNVLMSGRHLQHTDRNLKNRNLEVVTNCSTSVLSVVLFYLLLNGSGVGRSYDDDVMLIDWCLKMPHVKIAISDDYPDRKKTKVDWCDKAQAMIEMPLVGAHIKNLHETYLEIPVTAKINVYKVADSRGGWAKAVEQVERMAYEGRTNEYLILEFSDVRPNGQPIRGMQNRPASGPGPLMDALYSIAQIKYKRMPAWEATMHVDHFLAQCVLVGGARRAARMATKHWKDSTIFGFIDFKERNNYWTSNNSVAIDDEFRERSTKMIGVLKSRYDEFDEMSPDELIGAAAEMLLVTDTLDDWDFHAFRVLVEISDSLYHNGKGEPGIINQDKLKVDDSGIEDYIDGMFADSKDFSLDPTTMALTRALARVMITMRYSMIVNPCGEIALLMLGAYCVIADVVPFHADTDDDAEAAFRAAVRALIRTNTMDSLYSREVQRTNRIGVGLTGFHEWAYARFGFTWHDLVDETKSMALWRLMSRFRRAVTDEARSYSAKLGVVQPHTDTTFKPAGTTSKLFGLSEGAHLPSMRWYMRWVQFRQDDPLIADYAARGYPTRALRDYPGTVIVGFPTAPSICELDGGNWVVTAAEASPEDQYEFIRLLEKYWLHGVDENDQMLAENFGNQISYTLKYDPAKVSFNEFFSTLIDGQFSIKCCSVMPQTDASGYEYQPEEPITREIYLYHMAQITSGQEDIGLEHLDCANGACPVDFGARA